MSATRSRSCRPAYRAVRRARAPARGRWSRSSWRPALPLAERYRPPTMPRPVHEGARPLGNDMATYDRLSALDATFLHLERLEYPMHVGAVSIFEGEPFFDENGRFKINEVRELVLSRLPLLPRFRKKL